MYILFVSSYLSTVVVLAGNARAEAGRRSGAARPSNNPAVRRWSRWRADLASVDTSRHGQAMFGNAWKQPLKSSYPTVI